MSNSSASADKRKAEDMLRNLPQKESEPKKPRLDENVGTETPPVKEPNTRLEIISNPADKRQVKDKKTRGRGGRRTRDGDNSEREIQFTPEGEPIPKEPRLPKRQCALLIGFCGSGYSGMQIQPDLTRTIEGVLFTALVKVGAVSKDNADNPVKVGLARAARTDAGVHAAGNVVSLKMIITIPGVNDIVALVNEQLPPEIRLWGYVRTQNSFNARLVCESRKYTYFFPSYLLIPPKPGSGFHRVWLEQVGEPSGVCATQSRSETFWEDGGLSAKEEDLVKKRTWRVSQDQMESLRKLVNQYEGTHNFHNFTVGREFGDRSNNRYMKKIEVSDPVVYGDTEWISVLFHGQSFMLHQRKMMAALVLACRMGTPARVIAELYGQRDIFVPKMPALGLLLEEPMYTNYNERMAAINTKLKPTDFDYRPLVDFDLYRDKINAFKEQYIYKNMREIEDRDGLFDAWIRTIDAYAGDDLRYFNRTGAIPDASVISAGAHRSNPFKEKRVFDATNFPLDQNIKTKLDEDVAELEEEEEILDKRNIEETEG